MLLVLSILRDLLVFGLLKYSVETFHNRFMDPVILSRSKRSQTHKVPCEVFDRNHSRSFRTPVSGRNYHPKPFTNPVRISYDLLNKNIRKIKTLPSDQKE